MRVLIGPDAPLHEVYAAPEGPWLRANMVSTVDGAATGDNGTSTSINNATDQVVFDLLRELSDAIVVGAGTLRAEQYRPNPKPIVVVSRSGEVPEWLLRPRQRAGDPRDLLGGRRRSARAPSCSAQDNVMVLGSHRVDLVRLREQLVERGYPHLLSEGGPHLLRDLLDQGCVDEVDTTTTPLLVCGRHPRITDGPPVDVPLELRTLVEQDGTLMARWTTA